MPVLREITKVSPDAAVALQLAGFVNDTDIRSVTRQDLNELIPGPQNIRLRKKICDIIQNVKPLNAVLSELDFIPDDCAKAALTKNCFLDDYLVILKDMETKVESVNSFLKAHIEEEYDKKQQKPQPASLSVDFETRCAPLVKSQFHGQAQPASSSVDFETRCAPLVKSQFHGQGSVAAQSTVRVQVIVKGETFDGHRTLLQRVRQLGGLHVDETDSGPKVVIVFYPLKTCHMTDIEAAMEDVVAGGAAVILVVMHHTHDVNYPHIVRSLDSDRGWDFVNVLYHETELGLLPCVFNEQAVAQLRGALLKHSSVVSPVFAATAAAQVFNPQQAGCSRPRDDQLHPLPIPPRTRMLPPIPTALACPPPIPTAPAFRPPIPPRTRNMLDVIAQGLKNCKVTLAPARRGDIVEADAAASRPAGGKPFVYQVDKWWDRETERKTAQRGREDVTLKYHSLPLKYHSLESKYKPK